MEKFEIFEKHRRIKQMFMAAVFILVLFGGWVYPVLGFFIPLCMLLGVGIAIQRGRKWCDWYCPRGSFWDFVLKPVSPKKEIPLVFKSLRFRIGVLSFLMAIMAWQIISRWPDTYKIGRFFVVMLSVTTGLGILLALIYHQRFWCYLCPIGTLASFIGKGKQSLMINFDDCVECKLCAKVCPMQIKPYLYKKEGAQPVANYDCLKCNSCVSVCPRKALKLLDK